MCLDAGLRYKGTSQMRFQSKGSFASCKPDISSPLLPLQSTETIPTVPCWRANATAVRPSASESMPKRTTRSTTVTPTSCAKKSPLNVEAARSRSRKAQEAGKLDAGLMQRIALRGQSLPWERGPERKCRGFSCLCVFLHGFQSQQH